MKSLVAVTLLLSAGAWYGVYRLVTWPIRSVVRHWPGRRERLLQARVAQLRRAIADAQQLVAVLGANVPELQTTFVKKLRKIEKEIDLAVSEQGWADDLEKENPWADAIKALDKAKRVQGINSASDAVDLKKVLTSLLGRHDRKLDCSFLEQNDPRKTADLQTLLSVAVTQLAAMGYVLAHIDEGSGTYVFALCTPEEFAQIQSLASTGYSVRRFKPGDSASTDQRRFRSDTHERRHVAGYHAAGPDLPDPIPGRVGRVGGIESLSIDQRRYFFGFSYSDDRVLSPLLEDKKVMAEFAAAYMSKADDVPHGIDYWLEDVETAVANSGLCDDKSRTLTATQLNAFAAGLAHMQSQDVPSPDLIMDPHLVYLLNACIGEKDEHFLTLGPELERLGLRSGDREDELEIHELTELLEMGRGELPLPPGASFIDVAVVLRDYLKRTLERLPPNWSLLFGMFVTKV